MKTFESENDAGVHTVRLMMERYNSGEVAVALNDGDYFLRVVVPADQCATLLDVLRAE